MNAPKKLWFDIDDCSAGPVQFSDDEIPYIRADIVDELVEALERLARLGNGDSYGNSIGNEIAKAALKKLEVNHERQSA